MNLHLLDEFYAADARAEPDGVGQVLELGAQVVPDSEYVEAEVWLSVLTHHAGVRLAVHIRVVGGPDNQFSVEAVIVAGCEGFLNVCIRNQQAFAAVSLAVVPKAANAVDLVAVVAPIPSGEVSFQSCIVGRCRQVWFDFIG